MKLEQTCVVHCSYSECRRRVGQGCTRSYPLPHDTSTPPKTRYTQDMPVKGYKHGDFKKLSTKLAKKGTKNPNALAAYIERKRLGAPAWNQVMREGRKQNKKNKK